MQWWCSATGEAWSWQWQAYPGVWLFALTTAALYALAVRRIHGTNAAARPRWRRTGGWVGVVLVWVALDWPLGALGAGYLSSAHSTQFLLLAFIAPPLLLFGAGPVAVSDVAPQRSRWLAPFLSPLTALILFNVVVIATHMPRVVDSLMRAQLGAFAIDAAWVLSGLLFWKPVVLTRWPMHPLARIGYIFWGTIAHTGIGVWFLLADFPLYALFELAPPIPGTDPMSDQQLAGGIMELVGMFIIFGAISLVALRWMTEENRLEAENRDRLAGSGGSVPSA